MRTNAIVSHSEVISPLGLGLNKNVDSIMANKQFYQLNHFNHYHSNFPPFLSGIIPDSILSQSNEFIRSEKVLDLLLRSMSQKIQGKKYTFDKFLILFRGVEVYDLYLKQPHSKEFIQQKTDVEIIHHLLIKNNIPLNSKDIMVIDNTCTTGISLITYASQYLKSNPSKKILVCAIDLINPFILYFLNSLGALVNSQNNQYLFSMPFDKNRNGFVKTESGSIAIVSNDQNISKEDIQLELVGYSQTNDGYRITDGRDDGLYIKEVMKKSIEESSISIKDISFIKAHGTSTALNDQHEAEAINEIFGAETLVTSLKGHLGHTTDASGLIENVLLGELVKKEIIPCTLNTVENPFNINLILKENLEKKDINYFMCNAFGFGGNNISAIFKSFKN